MTKDEFLQLLFKQRESVLTLIKYLQEIGLSCLTYTYWNRKFRTLESGEPDAPFAQVTL